MKAADLIAALQGVHPDTDVHVMLNEAGQPGFQMQAGIASAKPLWSTEAMLRGDEKGDLFDIDLTGTWGPGRPEPEADPLDPLVIEICDEVVRACRKFPTWPTDPMHALAVVGEEYGELQKAVLQSVYEPRKGVTREDIREEAVQTAAMAIRWAHSLDRYAFEAGDQHAQQWGAL